MKHTIIFSEDKKLQLFVSKQIKERLPNATLLFATQLSLFQSVLSNEWLLFVDYSLLEKSVEDSALFINTANECDAPLILIESNPDHQSQDIGQLASIVSYAGERAFANHLLTTLEHIDCRNTKHHHQEKSCPSNSSGKQKCRQCMNQFFQDISIGFVSVNIDGSVRYMNKALMQIIGNPELSIRTGDNINQLIKCIHAYKIEGHNINEISDPINLPFEGEKINNLELLIERTDGEKRLILVNASPIFDENKAPAWIMYLVTDITNERNIESELAYEKYLIQSLMDNIPDSIYFKDINSKYTRVNQAHAALLGIESPDQVIGKTNIEFLPIDLAISGLRDEQQIIKSGIPIISKVENLEREDHVTWLSTTKAATKDEYGEINGIVGISRDITQLKLIQDSYKRAMEKAEQSDKLKTAFLANMSHEIRTPMNAIVGFSNLLRNEVTIEKRNEFVKHINESCQNLLHLITDIIEMAKIQAGEELVSNEYFDFNESILTLHEIMLEDKTKQNIEIFLNIPNNRVPLVIFSDLNKITYIFTSLLRNAVKFTENGYVELGYIFKDPTTLQCYVKDTGIGIEASKLDLIFSSFNKQTDRKTKLYGGTGLGLAITRHFVKMLSGDIWVDTKLGEGSTFYFTLPIKIIDEFDTELSLSPELRLEMDEPRDEKFVVLIAEDEELNFILLQEALQSLSGLEIIWAKNGVEAVSYCRDRKDIQLVLMDLKMPMMDGLEATNKIRMFRRDIHIWAQTAYSSPSDRKLLINAGCDDYILKPINPETIREKIKQKFYSFTSKGNK